MKAHMYLIEDADEKPFVLHPLLPDLKTSLSGMAVSQTLSRSNPRHSGFEVLSVDHIRPSDMLYYRPSTYVVIDTAMNRVTGEVITASTAKLTSLTGSTPDYFILPSSLVPTSGIAAFCSYVANTGNATTASFQTSTTEQNRTLQFHKPQPLAEYARKYSRPNWDGYVAVPITAETIAAARTFLTILPDTLGSPDIAPGADGTIGLEWAFDNGSLRKLFIDIGPDKIWNAYWRRASGDKNTLLHQRIDLTTKAVLAELFQVLSE